MKEDIDNDVDRRISLEATLSSLDILAHTGGSNLDERTLVFLTAYANSQDPWTTKESAKYASHLLEPVTSEDRIDSFIVESILQNHLRPLFSNTTNKVTQAGRPAQCSPPDQRVLPQGLRQPEWKTHGSLIISMFRWAVVMSTVENMPTAPTCYAIELTQATG